MPVSRRRLLQMISAGTAVLTASPRGAALDAGSLRGGRASFPQGVASGDPQPDAVMLWTRAVPTDAAAVVDLILQVSQVEDFTTLVLEAALATDSASDYTVRARVQGLQPDRHYYYRFLGPGGTRSRTGRTLTAPAPGSGRSVRLAFVSCQSYENAHYGGWARMLADDARAPEGQQLQFVLHLGDFIYERCWHRRRDGSPQARQVPPFPDGASGEHNRHAVSLADYRHLYKTYLEDPWLQAARARWPFICTWDDHEFSNDNFQGYSNYEGGPRAEPARKLAANQAWFEYIPAALDELPGQPAYGFTGSPLPEGEAAANRAASDSLCIYRRLRWGSHLDIVLTDTRSYRSPPCLPEGFAASLGQPMNPVTLVEIADAGKAYAGGRPPATLPYGDGTVANPARERAPGSCLGETQRAWLLETLQASTATWKLWGNSLPLIPMRVDLSSLPFSDYEDCIFNLDAWAGYPHEVKLLMQTLRDAGVTGAVSLSGDHHMHGAGTIRASADDPQAPPVMVDFSVAGIASSPLYEELEWVARERYTDFQPLVYRDDPSGTLPLWNMTMLDGALAAATCARTGLRRLARWLGPNRANPGLAYIDTTANGYGLVQLDGAQMRVQMVTLDDLQRPVTEPPPVRHIARFRLQSWDPERGPELEGPTFEGGAPFPFDPATV